jgi:hypothetical protein
MRIRILESAIVDLEAGKNFYDRQEAGVGDYFQDCLISDIDSLVLYGGMHRKVFGFHRLLSKHFPYAIYYLHEGDVVVVYRILDCRRDPQRIRRSLEDR